MGRNEMKFKVPFSYYGGKGKMIRHYPAPRHELIIEPFCGAAAYSWQHREGHDIWVNDLDPKTFAIWQFLTRPDALDIVRQWVPERVTAGQKCLDFLFEEIVPDGLIEICRAEANQGTQGARGVHDQITSMGAKCWPIFVRKLPVVLEGVREWKVTNLSYEQLPDVEATWFIDPPYSNVAGSRYRQANIDYRHLADWCLSRRGQVIVCENEGADWLPFQSIDHTHLSIRSRYQRASAKEVVWTNDDLTFNGKPVVWDQELCDNCCSSSIVKVKGCIRCLTCNWKADCHGF